MTTVDDEPLPIGHKIINVNLNSITVLCIASTSTPGVEDGSLSVDVIVLKGILEELVSGIVSMTVTGRKAYTRCHIPNRDSNGLNICPFFVFTAMENM